MTVTILKENVEYPEYHLDNPNGLTKGYYLSKCKEDVLFQLPLLKSKSGVVCNTTNNYIDLIIDSDNNLVNNLFLNLEKNIKEEIKKKQSIWFSNNLLDDDINYYFLDTVKGNILRIDVPDNLYVFNKDHDKLEIKDIKGKELICILEFVGLRFSTTSFKLHFNLKQVMVYESKYEKCIVETKTDEESQPDDLVILEENTDVAHTEENTDVPPKNIPPPPDENTDIQSENNSEDESDEDDSDEDESDEDDTLSEVVFDDLVKDEEEIMKLEKPIDIYKKTYYETYERAKAAKQYAIKTFLEAKKIKQLHLLSDLESSDEEDLNLN